MTASALKYSDVCLIPRMGQVTSRSDCDTSVWFLGNMFKLPIMPANMKSVIDENLAHWLSENDYFYAMHRFNIDPVKFVVQAHDWKTISISIGVKENDYKNIEILATDAPDIDYITIDIAHGHCELMKRMIHHVKEHLPNVQVIAGNIATPEAAEDLSAWGASAVKVGIGQGSPCTTKDKTGFTMPMYTCVAQCTLASPVPVIADGGITCNGDIAKALQARAAMVMAGGLFASCTDSPAASLEIDGVLHKAYFGSASFENKHTRKHIEGKLKNITSSGMTYKHKLAEIEEDLQSSISYAGGNDLAALRDVDYYIVSI